MKKVKVKIRASQIEHLAKELEFDRRNNNPPALVSVSIMAELDTMEEEKEAPAKDSSEWWEREFGVRFITKENGLNEPTVHCHPDFLKEFIHKVSQESKRQGIEEAREIASLFCLRNDIHPDIKFAEMNETAKMVANSTAQQIALEITSLITDKKL